ncbi:nuclear transport factor 2 family protein [Microlunatus parietis]|uniref:3-phenylpropionate/cinnamic acid dioxygenase small subunit n=1 Tax=Microlunatus parietis TaxID=682979 RepID=A0A7Y9LDD6_9ACTN|nr:nuclear transport factor 2 family protein [Microlunatus parietis]NYE73787.1 3-phenylpropionate/cinnamic acid dioxygenase small subunit [Microlunatus parietis]
MPLSTADRLAIHELISLHGHLADDRRHDDLAELLTEDAAYDVSDFGLGTVRGLPALTDLFRTAPGDQPRGHHVTNVIVTEEPGLDDVARVRSKGIAVMADGRADTVGYDDEVVRTPAGWRIRRRKVVARS